MGWWDDILHKRSHMWWVQIFCLIYYAPLYIPPIKLEQLASPINWVTLDVNVKMRFFFPSSTAFVSSLWFLLLVSFGFFFSLLYVVLISSVHLHHHFTLVTDTSVSLFESFNCFFKNQFCFYWFVERKSFGFFCYRTFWGFNVGVKCEEKQSDLSMVIMVFDFCSIRKHVERKTFLNDVKVVVSK